MDGRGSSGPAPSQATPPRPTAAGRGHASRHGLGKPPLACLHPATPDEHRSEHGASVGVGRGLAEAVQLAKADRFAGNVFRTRRVANLDLGAGQKAAGTDRVHPQFRRGGDLGGRPERDHRLRVAPGPDQREPEQAVDGDTPSANPAFPSSANARWAQSSIRPTSPPGKAAPMSAAVASIKLAPSGSAPRPGALRAVASAASAFGVASEEVHRPRLHDTEPAIRGDASQGRVRRASRSASPSCPH